MPFRPKLSTPPPPFPARLLFVIPGSTLVRHFRLDHVMAGLTGHLQSSAYPSCVIPGSTGKPYPSSLLATSRGAPLTPPILFPSRSWQQAAVAPRAAISSSQGSVPRACSCRPPFSPAAVPATQHKTLYSPPLISPASVPATFRILCPAPSHASGRHPVSPPSTARGTHSFRWW